MLTRSTPSDYRAQCATLAFLAAHISPPLADPDNPTQVNPEWHTAAKAFLRKRGATRDHVRSLNNWVEDENESGLLTGSSPSIPRAKTTRSQNIVAVDRRGDTSTDQCPGVYAISGGALLIRGRTR